MAKKKEERSEPIISSIPVPPSDSALVIDLPDGQKLLVGKIETGTVIEVATWRGTGRPDSRTNRLMLGMSSESEARQQESEDESAGVVKPKANFPNNIPLIASRIITVVLTGIKVLLPSAKDFSRNIIVALNRLTQKVKSRSQRDPKMATELSTSLKVEEDFDVDFQRILDEVSQKRVGKSSVDITAASRPKKQNSRSSTAVKAKAKSNKAGKRRK